jgi:hypothetical protein
LEGWDGRGTRDLIPTADFGSDGSGWVGEHRRRQKTPAIKPAAARLGARQSLTFPSLWWSNFHGFRPGSINMARGIDLGLQLGLGGLGLRDPRLGAEDIAGEWRSRG